jgi:hypothetical protein
VLTAERSGSQCGSKVKKRVHLRENGDCDPLSNPTQKEPYKQGTPGTCRPVGCRRGCGLAGTKTPKLVPETSRFKDTTPFALHSRCAGEQADCICYRRTMRFSCYGILKATDQVIERATDQVTPGHACRGFLSSGLHEHSQQPFAANWGWNLEAEISRIRVWRTMSSADLRCH